MRESGVYFVCISVNNPAPGAEPFAVCRVDTKKRVGIDGCEAQVVSVHWSEYVANEIANDLDAREARGELWEGLLQ